MKAFYFSFHSRPKSPLIRVMVCYAALHLVCSVYYLDSWTPLHVTLDRFVTSPFDRMLQWARVYTIRWVFELGEVCENPCDLQWISGWLLNVECEETLVVPFLTAYVLYFVDKEESWHPLMAWWYPLKFNVEVLEELVVLIPKWSISRWLSLASTMVNSPASRDERMEKMKTALQFVFFIGDSFAKPMKLSPIRNV